MSFEEEETKWSETRGPINRDEAIREHIVGQESSRVPAVEVGEEQTERELDRKEHEAWQAERTRIVDDFIEGNRQNRLFQDRYQEVMKGTPHLDTDGKHALLYSFRDELDTIDAGHPRIEIGSMPTGEELDAARKELERAIKASEALQKTREKPLDKGEN